MVERPDEPRENLQETLHRQVPLFGWLIAGFLVLALAGLSYYLTRHSYEHVARNQYVGPGKCKACHEKQYESWGKTRMANSFSVLRPGEKAEEKRLAGLDPTADYTHDPACLACHTTGYGLEGGFVSIETTPAMAGVTCEACHGPGGSYVNAVMATDNPRFQTAEARNKGLVYPPTEEVCRVCHNAKSPFVGKDYRFDYQERVKLGTHEHFKLKYEHGR